MCKETLISTVVAILIGFTGCVETPRINLDNESRLKLREEVRTYNIEELQSMKYKHLASVDGLSCAPPALWDSKSFIKKEDAVDELRYRSKALGGNGIVNVTCGEAVNTSMYSSNCVYTLICNAVAIQVEPTGHHPSVASGQASMPAQNVEQLKKRAANEIGPVRLQDAKQLPAGVVKITVRVDGKTRVGAGVIVKLEKDAAYIITASHVIEGEQHPQVMFFSEPHRPFKAQVLGLEGGDPRGLAALRVEGQLSDGLQALVLDQTAMVSGGEAVMLIGFPLAEGIDWTITTGTISGRKGSALSFAGIADEGNSGGPVLFQGKVVGIVTQVGQKFNYAAPAMTARFAIEGWGVRLP
jgi:S1-C subfamily serine protease